ncbi:MAG: tail fiber domain-containing protein [Prevotellaceae bacterium]|jgi:hypothetical protein|nr:tail fiber domain-containing protein [Prevotellaceae bacterium]
MKKLLFSSLLCICAVVLSAQVIVQNNGYTMVGNNATGTILSKLAVGSLGNSNSIVDIKGYNSYGLSVYNSGPSGTRYGIYVRTVSCTSGPKTIGIHSESGYNESGGCPSVGIGVRGLVGGGPFASICYGLSGMINGTLGTGLYAGIGNSEDTFTGTWAGYLNGNSIVTNGTLTATVVAPSDSRLKQNVQNIDVRDAISKLLKLRPVEYQLQQMLIDVDSTDENDNIVHYQVKRYKEDTPFFTNKRYGLIAQEVQKIYPDIVYEGGDGYLGIDYTSLVPMLLKVVQQQQTSIEQLQKQLAVMPQQSNAPALTEPAGQYAPAELYQNAPNPFNENTEIGFYLPQTVSNALLCVYDMNGKQLSQTVIAERGNAKFVINGKSYSAGMYLYSLIADNQVIDTKRMILTK